MTVAEVNLALERTRETLGRESEPVRLFDAWHFQRSPDDRRTQAQMAREQGVTTRHFECQLRVARQAFRLHLLRLLSPATSSLDQVRAELGRIREALRGPVGDRWRRGWTREHASRAR